MATRKLSDFERAFANARRAGLKDFTWKNPRTGKTQSYTTELKEEADARRAKRQPAAPEPAPARAPAAEEGRMARGPRPGPTVERAALLPGRSILNLPGNVSPMEMQRQRRMMQPGSQAIEPIMPEAALLTGVGAAARGVMGAARGAARGLAGALRGEAPLPLSMRPPPGADPNEWRMMVARMNRAVPGGARSTSNVPMIRPISEEAQAFTRFASPQARQVSGETGRRFSPEWMVEAELAAARGSVGRRQIAETRAGRKAAADKAKAEKPVGRTEKESSKPKRTRFNEDEAAMEFKRGGAVKKPGDPGLYANINAKRERIASGSGEKMRKPGSAGAPTAKAFRESAKTAKKR
jgi:hypothetical protein